MTPIAAPEPVRSSLLTRLAVGISIVVHLAAVALSLGYAGAGLFEGGEAEAVAVTVVTPEQVAALASEPTPSPDLKPKPDSKLDLRLSPRETLAQQQALRQQANPQPSSAAPATAQQATATPPAPPAFPPTYAALQPDVSMRYQVDLGLKEMAVAPPSAPSNTSGASDFDAPATSQAAIGTDNIAAFRAHLKACAALPAPLSPDDKVMIVLRARFTPDGRLAAPPILIEASASAKGPALMQAAIAALQSCQPYAALPADRYAEWRVLDLRFTPQDFRKG